MKDNRDLEQVLRLDGSDSFVEVMLSGLAYDKVMLNFNRYDASQPNGKRMVGNVAIFMNTFEALRLSRDIMSGRICALGKKATQAAKVQNKQYAASVFESIGGTSASRSSDGKAIARSFTIAPGAKQPWILCAKQGPGEEIGTGLIKMAGSPDVTIRVPVTNEKLKEFALAIETVVRIWEQLRFVPAAQPMMDTALERRREAIEKAKNKTVVDTVTQDL